MKPIGEFLVGILFVAGIFVMVRPRSQGPDLVKALTQGTVDLVTAATGGGTW